MFKAIKTIFSLSVFLLITLVSIAQNFEFKGMVGQSVVGIDDYVELQYVLEQVQGLQDFRGPNIQGFELINQSQGTSVHESIINGKRTSKRYIVTTYILRPQKVGNFSIGPAKVKVDDQIINSNTVQVQVVKESQRPQYVDPFDAIFGSRPGGSQRSQQQQQQQERKNRVEPSFSEADIQKNIFIKVEVDQKQPFKGQQVNASYKLYTRLPMNMSITQLPSLNGFWSEDFVLPKVPKPTTELVNGLEYQVFVLKKTALFPQQEGQLILDPAQAEGNVRIMERTKSNHPLKDDPFFSFFMDDPFFDDAFFNNVSYRDVPVKLKSAPVTIQVKPLPNPQPKEFTGGVGQFTITENLEQKKYTTDDVIEYKIIIEGVGNTKFISLPKVDFTPELGAAEPIILDTIIARSPNIISRKVITYLLNPNQAGNFSIPSFLLKYYDPSDNQYKNLSFSAQSIHVEEGSGKEQAVENFYQVNPTKTNNSIWQWIGIIGGIFIIVIALIVFLKKKRNNISSAPVNTQSLIEKANERLKDAQSLIHEEDGRFFEEVNKALWLFIAERKGINLGDLKKDEIINSLQSQLPRPLVAQIQEITQECQMALYAPNKSWASKDELLKKVRAVLMELETKLLAQ